MSQAATIVAFWRDAGKKKWFEKDAAFDDDIRRRFGALVDDAGAGRLDDWAANAEGALALLLLLDQFPRNIFRGSPRMFASDGRARDVAASAIDRGFDDAVESAMRSFFYLPFMHSEALADQDRCVALYQAAQDNDGAKWAIVHRDIIEQFGRFPHRNETLGRATTPAEEEFLKGDGFKG